MKIVNFDGNDPHPDLISVLLDEADQKYAQRRKRLKYLDNPRYASGADFHNPFYVIVHADQVDAEMSVGNLNPEIGSRIKAEIGVIKSRHPGNWTEAGRIF